MLQPKVRSLVDGLPFDTEGYIQAKNILMSKYCKVKEVVNAHVQVIMTLPIVHGSISIRIHEFYEELLALEQLLKTMGNVQNTLDKLPQVWSELVRFDGEWKQWDFPKLIEALRQWVKRNPVTKTGKEKPPT